MSHNIALTKEVKSESAKFNIPPSKVVSLSSQTTDLLNELKITSLKPIPKSPDEILNSVTAREKYQDLLDPVLKLSLPYKYKRLLKLQEYLDTTLNNARIRDLPRHFNILKQAIEATYACSFEIEHLKKILFLCPEFYILKWTVDNSLNQLVIDLPEESSYSLSVLHNRSSVLKDEMMKRVKGFHNCHLKSLGISFDPDVCRTWHSSFSLHDVQDIPMANLPEQHEDHSYVKKIHGNHPRVRRLSRLCNNLMKIFNDLKTPSIFIKSLVKKVLEATESEEEHKLITADLVEISEIFPNWLTIIKTESGEVVRINKTTEYSSEAFLKKLKEKYLVN
jgi:hypothetical protein